MLKEDPLIILPLLAKKIGLNEAIVLQQIHSWINNECTQNVRNGRFWAYNTYDEWRKQFPFWSYDTVKRTIKSLENKKLLISDEFNKPNTDRTKWYAIDYDELSLLLEEG